MPTIEMLVRNTELLRSRINRHGIYGLVLSLIMVGAATAAVSYQLTGAVTLAGMFLAQQHNFALRLLDLMPVILTIWGQYTGSLMARHASALIVEQTDDLRAETTAWKKKSLHDATHDSLTELPNRVLFYDALQQAVQAAERAGRGVAVLFIDLDGFKEINDAFGPLNGDLILRHAATRLKRLVPDTDTIARMGGDEFAILIRDVPSIDVAARIAQRVRKTLDEPFVLDRHRINVPASVGISRSPEHGTDADALVQRAEAAMAAAKRAQEGYAVYSDGLVLDNPRRLMLMTELRHAVERGALELHFQPKVDIRAAALNAVETLVRWTHPQHGRISPQEFIPLAERTRIGKPLTEWVLKAAVKQLADWNAAGFRINVAMNVSVRDLMDPETTALIGRLVADRGIVPGSLTLEITEGSIMENTKDSLDVLGRLNDMGLRLSIDDFGTGYSSLAYLSRLPVQELKIDKSFVIGMTKNRGDRLIVDTTVDLGHKLGLEVVAEGVEDESMLDQLRDMGCDIAQGYYISPPLPRDEFEKWARTTKWRAAGQIVPGGT